MRQQSAIVLAFRYNSLYGMIVSRKHRFIFVKGRKVAGTSVEFLLSGLCGPHDVVTPITPVDERLRLARGGVVAQNYGLEPEDHAAYLQTLQAADAQALGQLRAPRGPYYNHMPLAEALSLLGPLPPGWRILGVERCPYRKIISLACMKLTLADYRRGEAGRPVEGQRLRRMIDRLVNEGGMLQVRNIDLYRDAHGRMQAELLRFEHLAPDLDALLEGLGVTERPPLPHLKRGRADDRVALSAFFNVSQLGAINQAFADEFESFGYPMAS